MMYKKRLSLVLQMVQAIRTISLYSHSWNLGHPGSVHTNTLLLNYAFNTLQTISSIPSNTSAVIKGHCVHSVEDWMVKAKCFSGGYMQDNLANHLQHMQRDNALTLKVAMSLFIKSRNRFRMHFTVKNILVSISSIGKWMPFRESD